MATVTYIKEAKQHISAMKAVIRYCQREDKTIDPKTGVRYVTGLNCNGPNSFTEFLATNAIKAIWEEHAKQQKENLRFMIVTIASSAVLSALVSGLFLLLGG